MTSEKLPYGHLTIPERSTRRERTAGPLGSVVGVLGAAAVFASAVVLAVIVQNVGHEMGNIRAKVERDQEEMAKLQEKVAILTGTTEKDQNEISKLQEKVATLTTKAEKSDGEITKLQALAQRDHDDMAKLQARAERDQEEVQSLRERIVVLETQIRGGSFPPNYAEQQQPSASPEAGQTGHVGETDNGVQNNNATTVGGLAHKRSKRDAPGNSLRLPPISGCCQNQAGRDGRDGRDGMMGAPGLKGEPGQKGDIGPPGEGMGAKGSKGETGMQGAKGQKGEQGTLAMGNNSVGGAVYTRWGRKTCPSGTTTVYSGYAGGTHYTHSGGGTNYQCLPTDPQWGRYEDGVQGWKAFMYGAEYDLNTDAPFSSSLDNHEVPCAVCYVPARGSKLMIPARNTCPTGWTQEYHGYLMAGYYNHATAKEYVCVDEQPEVVLGDQVIHNGALFYPVEAVCGSLPCPNYVNGRELTCVVCTK